VAYASPALATLGGRQQIVIVNQDFITGHDPADGRELWSIDWDGPSNSSANTSQAQPIGGDRLLVTKGYGGGARVFAVRHVGGGWAAQTLLANATALRTKLTNVVVHQGHAYGLSDGILQCVDLSTLSARWKRGRYGHGQTMLVGNLLLIQADTGEVVLVAADPQRHLELGRFQAIEGNTWNNPALWGPYLLVRNGEEAACYELPLAGGP
jgi:outer membrane protein assembly factor BamB